MPEHLKALVVILALAAAVFTIAKSPACAIASSRADFERRRNLWFGVTLAAFFAYNFWIYIVAVAVLLLFALRREQNKLAMFFFLLFALPRIPAEIPGLGVVSYLFEIDYLRLLVLIVLLPVFLSLRKQPGIERFGRSLPDKLIGAYIVYSFLLMLTYAPLTATLRHGVFYALIDIFLPYYVASRYLRNMQGFRDVLMSFVVAAMVLSAIGAFESAKQWLLYSDLNRALGVRWGGAVPLMRGENMRAAGPSGQAIVIGYLIAVAIGFYLYLRKSVPNRVFRGLGLLVLIVGLVAPLSRGPWVGAAVMLLVFVATGPAPALNFAKLGFLGLIAVPLILATPASDTIIDHLPWVGTIDAANVTGRQRLAEVSFEVFLQNPVFGRYDFLDTPAMESLRGGDGQIDLVNTYVVVGLSGGLVGLLPFAGFFIAAAIGIYRGMRNLADRNDEQYLLGQGLLATLLGILIIITTVSPIHFIPVVYWSVAGLGVAYARMVALGKTAAAASSAQTRLSTAKAAT